jgi:hypothetical protein
MAALPHSRIPADVFAWRFVVLRDAGFDERSAHDLADDARYDLHAVLDLVDRGCPPALARRIMAPLDP